MRKDKTKEVKAQMINIQTICYFDLLCNKDLCTS